MEPRDLETLADAAWWLSRSDESVAARQRAYAGYVADGDDPRAVWCAGRLCMEHFFRGEPALAAGWLMRASCATSRSASSTATWRRPSRPGRGSRRDR